MGNRNNQHYRASVSLNGVVAEESVMLTNDNDRLESMLKKSDAELAVQSAALEHAANSVVITNHKGEIVWVNPAFTELTGYTLHEIAGKTPRVLKSGKHNKEFYFELWKAVLAGRTWRGEMINRKKDGSLYVGEQTITPVRSASGSITHFIGIMNDITERRKVEDELRCANEKLRHVLAHSPAVIYRLRIAGTEIIPTMVSDNIEAFLGISPSESARCGWWLESLHPDDRERVLAAASRGMSEGEYSVEYRIRHSDGSYRWIEDNCRVIFAEGRRPTEAVGVWTDITSRKRLEGEIALRQHQLNSFFTGATAGLFIVDSQLRYIQVNETLAAMNGIPVANHVGRSVSDVLPNFAPTLLPVLQKVLETGVPIKNLELSGEVPSAPGETRFWSDSFFPIIDGNGETAGVGAIVVETTERKRAEKALYESEEKFRQLAENIEDLFWIASADLSRIIYASPAYEKIWGRPVQTLYQNPNDRSEAIVPEDRPKVLKAFHQLSNGAPSARVEYRIRAQDGSIRWILDRGFPIRNEKGEVYRQAGIATDLTEKKKLEQQFLRAQRMESVGTLAGGIAHDLNNALAPILMSIELFRNQFTDPDNLALLEMLSTSAQRGADMVKQLLTFSRGVEGQHARVQLKHLVSEIQRILRQTLPKSIQIRTWVAGDLWPLLGDVTQLHQVLLNLCVNARDAMPHGGDLTITAINVTLDEHFAIMSDEAKAGPYVVLSVADNGMGMPPEVRERIFDPFFTTKPLDKGTGLGLATVQGIVKSHGGFISVYTEVGEGTEFKIYLPARPTDAPATECEGAAGLPLGKGELILVVDDEEAIRALSKKTLEAFGYKVLCAADGAQAVALCAQNSGKIDLILSDLAMPIMDGAATIRAVRTLDPKMKIIAASGLDSAERGVQPEPCGANAFIHKPFTAEQILKALRQILDFGK